MKPKFKIIKKKKLYKGFFEMNEISFTHQKHDKTWTNKVKREVFGGAHVASVIPYDPIKKEIILLQQFRAGIIYKHKSSYLYEIVAGIIDKNEKPRETAARECFEETGCKVKKLIPVQSYFPAPGSSESLYHLFLAEIESFKGKRITGLKSENEDILVSCFKVDEVKRMLEDKIILNGLTLIALQWFFLNYY
tara:strand:- start:82 stop:657 length:576 start_codon:yes stop_codon:yes gene_type:complete